MFRVWSLCALVLSCFACKASAEAVKWPSDSAIRQWALEKRGLGLFGDGHAQQLALLKGASWAYDWSLGEDAAFVNACVATGTEYMPMIWSIEHLLNTTENQIRDVYQTNQTFPNTTRYLLGFNEPNKPGQSKVSSELAADAWPLMEKAAKHFGLKLVAPSPATCGRYDCIHGAPFTWWDDFFNNCTASFNRTCNVDAMAVHFYSPCDVGALQQMIDQVSSKYGKPIIITEFGCWEGAEGTMRRTVNFMRRATSYLDSDPRVLRYAWWSPQQGSIENMTGPNALWYGSGNQTRPTSLGNLYLEQGGPGCYAT